MLDNEIKHFPLVVVEQLRIFKQGDNSHILFNKNESDCNLKDHFKSDKNE